MTARQMATEEHASLVQRMAFSLEQSGGAKRYATDRRSGCFSRSPFSSNRRQTQSDADEEQTTRVRGLDLPDPSSRLWEQYRRRWRKLSWSNECRWRSFSWGKRRRRKLSWNDECRWRKFSWRGKRRRERRRYRGKLLWGIANWRGVYLLRCRMSLRDV